MPGRSGKGINLNFAQNSHHMMRIALTLIACCLATTFTNSQGLTINEFDTNQPGTDALEFIELHGEPGLDLTGYSIVLFNGFGDASYAAFDLAGMSTNAEGFFVLGSADVPNVDFVVPETAWLQPGPDAIALYEAQGMMFPNGTAPTQDDLVDALVYGTNSPADEELLAALTPGQTQLNEAALGYADALAVARVPDGGTPLDVSSFTPQVPTPGFSNVLQCDGGTLALANAADEAVCTDQEVVLVSFVSAGSVPEAATHLVVVDQETGTIVASFSGTVANFGGLGDLATTVWAISHDGGLDLASVAAGQPFEGIASSGCMSFSYNSVSVVGTTCDPPSCDGGIVTDASGTPTSIGCMGQDNAVVTFGYTSEAVEAEYMFCITDALGNIIDTTSYPQYDFTALGIGEYSVWGASALGGFDPATLAAGQPLADVTGIECDSLSAGSLAVSILDCSTSGFCEEIYISEYIEGNSNNKAIELYNPSPVAIDLSAYTLETWNNGASEPTNTQQLEGSIAPNGVFVLMNANAEPALFQAGDLVSQATWFNGNDVIALYHDGVLIDVMGEFGPDPGESWPVDNGEGAMSEYTLVRKANVSVGTTDWAIGQTQWDVYPQDTFDFIGYHIATCSGTPDMQIGFAAPELYVSEGGGVAVSLQVSYPLEDAVVQVSVAGGDAVEGADFPAVFPQNFSFPIGLLNDATFTFAAIDDEEPELQEDVFLTLTVVSGDVVWAIQDLVIHILPSDLQYPVYDIATVHTEHPISGIADSVGVSCELRGIVHGWNDYPSGLQFTLIDGTAGINVFSPVSDFGYDQVVAGDSVRIRGVVQQFAGLTQIIADTLIQEGTGFATEAPTLVNVLDETTESRIVTLKCVELVDPTQWTNNTPFFVVDVTTGTGSVSMRIDANTDIFGTEPPAGVFGVTGIADQRDFDEPFDDGYRISPRNLADLSAPVNAFFTLPSPWNPNDGPIPFTNLSEGAGSYFWSFGNGDNSQEANPLYGYPEDGTYTVILTANSLDGNCSDQHFGEIEVITVGVEEQPGNIFSVQIFPNPAQDLLQIQTDAPSGIVAWSAMDAMGRRVASAEGLGGQFQMRMDVSHWRPGVHLLHLTTGTGAVATARVVVSGR